jgi:hypothetical protein
VLADETDKCVVFDKIGKLACPPVYIYPGDDGSPLLGTIVRHTTTIEM